MWPIILSTIYILRFTVIDNGSHFFGFLFYGFEQLHLQPTFAKFTQSDAITISTSRVSDESYLREYVWLALNLLKKNSDRLRAIRIWFQFKNNHQVLLMRYIKTYCNKYVVKTDKAHNCCKTS